MENPDLVFQETSNQAAECHSRQAIQSYATRQSRQNGTSCQSFSKQYASGGTRPKWACFCHLAQQQTVSTCITGARSPNMDNDTVSLSQGGSGPICLPTGSHLGQVVENLQDYPCRGITLIAPSGPTCLVLGSLDHVMSDSLVPVQPALSTI